MGKDTLVLEAEAKVLAVFKESTSELVRKCGAEYFIGRVGCVWVSDLFTGTRANIEVYVDILGEPFQVRLCLDGPERLQVGWGSNNLLTTHLDSRNDYEIKGHDFITEVFRHEAEWRDALSALDLQPVFDAKDAVRAREEAEAKAKYEASMKAYNDAGIVVGSMLVEGRYEYEVIQVFKSALQLKCNKIRLGRIMMYKKDEVGARLLSGLWSVKA